MLVLARHSLAARAAAENPAGERLLLEGEWPRPLSGDHSLDEAIDARFAWIDREAAELVEHAGPQPELSDTGEAIDPWQAIAYLRALSLRYRAVRYLRPLAYFADVRPLQVGEKLQLHLEAGRDADYSMLFRELARSWYVPIHENCIRTDIAQTSPSPLLAPALWRRWAGKLSGRLDGAADSHSSNRVCLAGNPRILAPVCDALLETGAEPIWLTDRFAVGLWRRWRRRGVRQLVCGSTPTDLAIAPIDLSHWTRLVCRGVSLGPALARHLADSDPRLAAWQLGWLPSLFQKLAVARPECILLDEDATPWKRAVVAAARSLGIRTLVVQHGATCVSFGFAPLAADGIAVWDEGARRQLIEWGVPASRVFVCGAPGFASMPSLRTLTLPAARKRRPRMLLLATTPPRDERPDAVRFHLTTATYRHMLEVAFSEAEKAGVEVVVKPHPRAPDVREIEAAARRFARLDWSYARPAAQSQLLNEVDCVASCASTAGVEAAAAGAAVVQLLPLGSDDVLPAADWGGLGSARNAAEFSQLLNIALDLSVQRTRAPLAPSRAIGHAAAMNIALLALRGWLEVTSSNRTRTSAGVAV